LQIQSLRNNNLSIFKKHFSSFFIFFTFRFYSQGFIFFKNFISISSSIFAGHSINEMFVAFYFGFSFIISILICLIQKRHKKEAKECGGMKNRF